MKLYILRHGETVWNVEKRFQGQLDSPLTDRGIEKIKRTSKKLENIKFNKIYSSEMGRAIKTAEIIVKNNRVIEDSEKKICRISELNEINFGKWQGMNYEEISKRYSQNFWNYFNDVKKYNCLENDGEKLENGLKRFLQGLEKIIEENKNINGNILIVTHGTILELFFNYIKNRNLEDIDERNLIKNGDFKIIDYVDNKFIELNSEL